MSNNKVTPNGYIYLTTGEFVGKFGASSKVYAATRVKQTKDKDNPKLIKYEIKETADLEISHDNFCAIAGVIYYEDRSVWEGCSAIAHATLNMVRLVKGDKLSVSDENKWMKVLLFTGYSTASSKSPLRETSKSSEALNVRRGLIHVLMRKAPDHSDGAICWDGIDFAALGAKHNKAGIEGGISITRDLWEKLVNVSDYKESKDQKSPYYGKLLLNRSMKSNPQTKEMVLKNIPFLAKPDDSIIKENAITVYFPADKKVPKDYKVTNFSQNVYYIDWQLYESTGTHAKNNLGRILYKAAIVRGKQIYWKPNKDHELNKENKEKKRTAYQWKYIGSHWFSGKTICLLATILVLLAGCTSSTKKNDNLTIQTENTDSINVIGNVFEIINDGDNKYEVLNELYFEGDTVRPQIFPLKKDYQLSLLPVRSENDFDFITRLKGNNIDTVIWNSSLSSKYRTRYEGMDFEDYFCITESGGGYYLYITMFEKLTGKKILNGLKSGYDLKNQLLIFQDQENTRETEMTLFDIMNQKYYAINTDHIDDPMLGAAGTYSEYLIEKVTDNNIQIKLNFGKKKPFYFINIKR